MGGDQEATGNNSRMEGLRGSDGRVEEVEDAPPRMVLEKPGQLSSGQGVRLNEDNVGSSKGVVVRTDGECRVMGTSQVAPSFAVAHGKFVPRPVSVSDMVDERGDWDWGRLRGVLPEEVLDRIAAYPTPKAQYGSDVPGWRWDDKQIFSVRSAYAFLKRDDGNHRHRHWRRIWSLKVPQRVHVFMWLTVHGKHMSNAERVRRHLATSAECPICHDGEEDLDHILRSCPTACELWRRILGPIRFADFCLNPFDVWLMDNLSCTDAWMGGRMEWGACFSVWCWLLWKFRCSRVLDEDFIEREGIYDRGCRLLVECESTFGVTVAPVRELHRRQCWVGPARGWVKLNVDAADWVVFVRHVPRECNGVADSLAALGRDYGWQGSTFPAPPRGIVHRLDDEGSSGCRLVRCSVLWTIRVDVGAGCLVCFEAG
ncbi:hypothetical protein V6N12_022660 [Hibiscus sabdariffa]|uniref:Reverse transcriptase zinc-binding domain-containing protein n=1 Tax=Hibiscus sabdariffa TaxID=183260 RepID=A0ABR2FVC4_9ROSI